MSFRIGLLSICLGVAGCGADAPAANAVEDTLARERAAAHFSDEDWKSARDALAPLISRQEPSIDDLVRAAVVEYMDKSDQLGPLLARIEERDPKNASLAYMRARLADAQGEFDEALAQFEIAHASAPDDLPSKLGLASALAELGRSEEAKELYAEIIAIGPENGGGWYVTAVYHMLRMATIDGRQDDRERYVQLWNQLDALGYSAVSGDEMDRGDLAVVTPPRPKGNEAATPAGLPKFERQPAVLPSLAGATELFAHDVDLDGDLDLLGAGPLGVVLALRGDDGGYTEAFRLEGPADHVRAFDLGNDDSLDLVVARGAELLLIEASEPDPLWEEHGANRELAWRASSLALPRMDSAVHDIQPVDFDHEGDLDLLVVGDFGARLLRNDGAAPHLDEDGQVVRGSFTDATERAALPTGVALTWAACDDLDNDQDVDLVVGGPSGIVLMDSQRAGRFVDVSSRLSGGGAFATEPILADLDGDARPDLFAPGQPSRLFLQRSDGTFGAPSQRGAVGAGLTAELTDLDLDGAIDLVLPDPAGGRVLLAATLATETEVAFEALGNHAGPLVSCDLDGDLDNDVVLATAAGIEVLRCEGPVGSAVRIRRLQGLKDNRQGIGAIVEVRARKLYRRFWWKGDQRLIGVGEGDVIDVARSTWPNGFSQSVLDVDPGELVLEQGEAQIGSCPFLYTWNGETYEFITDVLGITPLGLPMAPGMLVPPDHDEYVFVRGDQLVPKDGFLEMQITEELREVTYLDRLRLDVIDHPIGTEVRPNERFSFPPFPEPMVHATGATIPPTSAIGSDGTDWAPELATIDEVHAIPFRTIDRQFVGLAEPHWIELSFDPEAVASAERLRLFLTGWFFWTDASVNMASAASPAIGFEPPMLLAPDAEGGWVPTGPPIGFPAGKTKTMVVDVTDLLDARDPRLRISTTLRLYWDEIRLATDSGDIEIHEASLEPTSAELWPRGFSAMIPTGRRDLPQRFDWEQLDALPRWDQHPGDYTRFGETLPLVQAIDDRYVILGSGDALRVRFDAKDLPELAEGFTRDYFLFLDGWAKDRDPNTLEALEVEPLPFHGMSGYPYGDDESFPSTEEHDRWRREWNTRPGQRRIPPLSPRREAAWLLGE